MDLNQCAENLINVVQIVSKLAETFVRSRCGIIADSS